MPKRRSSFWSGPWPIIGVLAGIVVVIAIFVLISRLQSPPVAGTTNPTPDASVISHATKVSPAVLDAVGTGGAPSPLTRVSGAPLTGSNGKAELLFLGAEWCPYCAAERWAMVVALSHFGTFAGLRLTTSSSTDVYPDTHTLSFYGSQLLQGLSWQQIASVLSNAQSPVTKAIVGNSNYLTAAICTLPGTSSAPICSDPAIKQIGSQLPH
ncbi:MAG: DUF929 domain-containing protein [Chloroflexi bacterium]|nr:MAG: DUF929 domain-containing protein [Chloroflexota bacterium]